MGRLRELHQRELEIFRYQSRNQRARLCRLVSLLFLLAAVGLLGFLFLTR